MNTRLEQWAWPLEEVGQALQSLAARHHLPYEAGPPPMKLSQAELTNDAIGRWITHSAESIGLEAEWVFVPYARFNRMLAHSAPAVFGFSLGGPPLFLAILGGNQKQVSLLGPDLRVGRFPVDEVIALFRWKLEVPLAGEIDGLLDEAGVSEKQRPGIRNALFNQRFRDQGCRLCWLLRVPAGKSFWHAVKQRRLPRFFAYFTVCHIIQYLLFLFAWRIVGGAAFGGQLDAGIFVLWGLLMLSQIPFEMLAKWYQGRFTIAGSGVLKQRLLQGALRLQPDRIRRQGIGQLLGRVLESETMETLILNGGFLSVLAIIDLAATLWVMSQGAAPWSQVGLLIFWLLGLGVVGRQFYLKQKKWTDSRLSLTHDLTEKMVGHQTRIVQQHPKHHHQGEDRQLNGYLDDSRETDGVLLRFNIMALRGWLFLGIAGLVPALFWGEASHQSLAIALAGVLLASRALGNFTNGYLNLSKAAIAWQRAAELFRQAAQQDSAAMDPLAFKSANQPVEKALQVADLSFSRGKRPILRNCNLTVTRGDRILLEGASGSGKSTLVSLLLGLHSPERGLVLMHGYDRETLGERVWSQHIAVSPQFHENHVFSGSFGFNLLMGREWPAQEEDLQEAQTICRELGLGPLLDQMPGGMTQPVGDNGWRLSHGERSRLFIARALLQGADVLVLDESLAALDPENLLRAARCVSNRAPSLILVAHP